MFKLSAIIGVCLMLYAAPLIAQVTQMSNETTKSASIVIHLDQPAKPISPDLFGIFFEDLNYAADGGLYAELIQNRSL